MFSIVHVDHSETDDDLLSHKAICETAFVLINATPGNLQTKTIAF